MGVPSLPQIFLAALRLGCTSFGGPIAHLAYFRRDYVERRGWISEAEFAELVALCQFLPGPASSQTGFGIGYRLRGWTGGLAAWTGFTLPSAALMIAFALGLAQFGGVAQSGALHGLKLAAVAVVAHAVIAMWRSLAPDAPRSALAVTAAGVLLTLPLPWMQLLVIAGGAALGAAWLRPGGTDAAPAPAAVTATAESLRTTRWPLIALVASLALLPLLTLLSNHPAVTLAERCQRAGALVFGGGHVVLPLLERAFVTPAGVTPDQFLAGYGAAQALPGPLFAFAAYLGAVQHGALGGVWALGWIFLPGLLLVPAVWPAWRTLRSFRSAQGALRGANATVVGLLLAALISPVARPALADASSAALAIGAFAALQFTRVPAWAVVLASAALGFALH